MRSPRLTYQPVSHATLDAFHRLVQDDHIRRYLLDGELLPREWSEQRVRDSARLVEDRGVGLWIASDAATGDTAGFCGFLEIPPLATEPQLVYALYERFTGRGYATEMAAAAIAEAHRQPGFDTIVASADDDNVASIRVLQKLGFVDEAVHPGRFGAVRVMRLRAQP